MLSLLEACAAATKPLADAHVRRMALHAGRPARDSSELSQLSQRPMQTGNASGVSTHSPQQGTLGAASISSSQQVHERDQNPGVDLDLDCDLDPWDVTFAAQRVAHAAGAHTTATEVLGQLELSTILEVRNVFGLLIFWFTVIFFSGITCVGNVV